MLREFLNRNKIKIILTTILLLILSVLLWVLILFNQKTFYDGIKIEGVGISGLNKKDAKELLEHKLDKVIDHNKFILKYEERFWEISLRDISYGFLLDAAIEDAYLEGRQGNILERVKNIVALRKNNINIILRSYFSKENLIDIINNIKKEIDIKEIDASISYEKGNITLEREVIGCSLDVDKSYHLIENKILERNFSVIDLSVEKVYPKVLYDEICDIKDVIGSFSTTFNSGKAERSYNIKLACERINNSLLSKEDIFSMDKALGLRTLLNGYKEAPVIIKGKLVKGVGGGVCQVTTTLYLAVLMGKLDVVERTGHSMVLGYVQPGQDATIAEGYIDFKFKNSLDYAILVNSEVVGNKIVVRLLGKKDTSDYEVRLKSVILEELLPDKDETIVDLSLNPGEMVIDKTPSKGIRVAVYRETIDKKSKHIINKEKISEDVYKPVKGRVRLNPFDDGLNSNMD